MGRCVIQIACKSLPADQIAVKNKKKLAPGVAYLGFPGILTAKSDSLLSTEDVLKGFQCVSANIIRKAADEYVALLKQGKNKDEAMEICSQSRFIAAKLHTVGYIFKMFKEAVAELGDGKEKETLTEVCALYGLWQAEELQAYFLKCQFSRPTAMMIGLIPQTAISHQNRSTRSNTRSMNIVSILDNMPFPW